MAEFTVSTLYHDYEFTQYLNYHFKKTDEIHNIICLFVSESGSQNGILPGRIVSSSSVDQDLCYYK